MSEIGEISADNLVSDMINLMQRYTQEDAFAKAIHRVVIGLHRVSEKAVRKLFGQFYRIQAAGVTFRCGASIRVRPKA